MQLWQPQLSLGEAGTSVAELLLDSSAQQPQLVGALLHPAASKPVQRSGQVSKLAIKSRTMTE
jgi:hypothetical protein